MELTRSLQYQGSLADVTAAKPTTMPPGPARSGALKVWVQATSDATSDQSGTGRSTSFCDHHPASGTRKLDHGQDPPRGLKHKRHHDHQRAAKAGYYQVKPSKPGQSNALQPWASDPAKTPTTAGRASQPHEGGTIASDAAMALNQAGSPATRAIAPTTQLTTLRDHIHPSGEGRTLAPGTGESWLGDSECTKGVRN